MHSFAASWDANCWRIMAGREDPEGWSCLGGSFRLENYALLTWLSSFAGANPTGMDSAG
jgi:hypothetical protein